MKNSTGKCYHCGAEQGLHQYKSMLCPKNGIEETRFDKIKNQYYPQQWEETTFEDSGIKKLNDAAPELLEALIDEVNFLKGILSDGLKMEYVHRSTINARVIILESIIKKQLR